MKGSHIFAQATSLIDWDNFASIVCVIRPHPASDFGSIRPGVFRSGATLLGC